MKRVNVGVVGAGGIFQGAHLSAYPDVEEARLSSLCNLSDEVLKASEREVKKVYLETAQKAEEKGNSDLAERLKDDAQQLGTYANAEEG